MEIRETKTSLPFIRAYNFLLEKKDLKPAEKLVLIVLCRFWPSPFWGANSTIAKNLGCSERHVQRLLNKLKCKGFIKSGYAHKNRDGKKHTVRVIIPLCMPGKCVLTDNKAAHDVDVVAAHDIGVVTPTTNRALTHDKHVTLLEGNRKENRESTPLPLPALGQAKALKEKMMPKTRITEQEFQERRRRQIKALMESSNQVMA